MTNIDTKLDDIYLFWLEKTLKSIRKAKNKLFKELKVDLTIDQWTILKSLDEDNEMTQKQLSTKIFKDPASITRSLDLLAKRDYIERVAQESDRRAFKIRLTEKGHSLVKKVLPFAVKLRNQGIHGLKEEDILLLRDTLRAIENNFDNY